MAHVIYDNFYLANEVEDQFNSHLDLTRFCTIDRTLTGVPGMEKKIHVYKATNGTERLEMGEGNTKSIEVSYTEEEYRIQLAQNRFEWYDEEAMIDPMLVPVGMKHMGTDLYNEIMSDIYKEFNKATLTVSASAPDFAAFVDAEALFNLENLENVEIFGFVNPKDVAKVRKALKDDLKYVESFVRNGYVGTVAGVNLYTKKDATEGTIVIGMKEAVTMFVKTGVELERPERDSQDANVRKNTAFSRKYYLAALTDATKAVKITLGA